MLTKIKIHRILSKEIANLHAKTASAHIRGDCRGGIGIEKLSSLFHTAVVMGSSILPFCSRTRWFAEAPNSESPGSQP